VRGAAPEPLMAGHLVDAGDHRAGDVHRTAVGSRVSCSCCFAASARRFDRLP
jgi:hypothetical protein